MILNVIKEYLLKLFIVVITLLAGLTACSPTIAVYQDRQPKFVMNEFFNGNLCVWGIVRNRNNEVSRKFTADIKATTSETSVELDENFVFDDGELQKRLWKFEKRQQQWIGTAGDVIGEAIGEVSGDTLHLVYELAVKVDGDEIIVSMDDWLHLVDKRTLLGSTDISKWGFGVGRIDITIQKIDDNNCNR
ncbi:MAG: hypothetical protein ACI9IA_002480 [Enterobacterales bacterium]|jgi:hypothetical protein